MIIFLCGEDTYRARQKLKEIIEHYEKIHKSGLNLKYFDCSKKEEISFSDLKDEIRQTSMFKEKKLIVITNPFSNPALKEEFSKETRPRQGSGGQAKGLLKSEDIILLYQEGEINKKDTLFKFLKKNVKCQEFKALGGQKLKTWIKKEFEKYEVKIEPPALEKFIDYVGDDLWRASNEIKKLVNYKKSKIIKAEDIELQVRSKIETDIFKTIDAIAQKNKKQALDLLHKHLEKGDSPLYLLSMINYQFRNLLIVKDFIEKHKPYNIILKRSGLHPFVVKKSYFQSQQFTLEELKKIYQKIFKVDLDIKTGRIEPETALDLLVVEI
jgi:DNA polymerase III delta subunit